MLVQRVPAKRRVAWVEASHGVETALIKGGVDVLGFVDDEQEGGGGADDVGFGVTGEEGNTGLIDYADELAFFAPEVGGEGVAGEDLIEADDGVDGLGFVGGVDGDHAEGKFGIGVEQVGHELDDELVLAGLAGKDDDDGVAVAVKDGFGQAGKGGDLVGPELEAGGFADKRGHSNEVGGGCH